MKHMLSADKRTVRVRFTIAINVCAATMALSSGAAVLAPQSASASSGGTREQIAWVRRAATNFVNDELRGDGAGACSVLNAPLRFNTGHRTCAERWDARLASLLHKRGARAQLHSEAHAIPSAAVSVRGNSAVISLPAPLISGANRFLWTENCWMLAG